MPKIADGLPESCYGYHPADPDAVTVLKRGVVGYYETNIKGGKAKALELNAAMGITPAQTEAMLAGSIFGFHVKAADPKMYEETGDLKHADMN